ncbi:hypothetical protein BGZ60DRAFT_205875 [Tricladium varicosporioides]|nr:hypothetical protein BGZ60DRAFT_205875 [Hymenoscyphus varicosporioides]
MILAFNNMDRERQDNRHYHKKIQDVFNNFEIARVQQDEEQRAKLEAYFATKAAEEAEEAEKRLKEAMEKKVRDLRDWMAASDWTTLLNAAEKHRVENTGNWFLRHLKYKSWIENQMQRKISDVVFSERLLFISGKPGYGKTVLSTRMISDIRRHIGKDEPASKGVIAYFYFNAQHDDSTSSISALRAIATQLLHDNKDDTDFIDLAALFMKDTGSGQSTATEKEIQSIIRIFLARLGPSFFIFDGLDECKDWEELLETLQDVTQGSNCGVVCLGRPHLSVATIVGSNVSQIRLEAEENLSDMKRYLEPKIQSLCKRGKLPDSLTVEEMVEKIASRADSMFLWVVLMISYLSSPLLTPNNRLQAINNIHVLEGLDAMFKQILEDLKRRLPKSEWSKIKRMFQWLVVAQAPWKLEMLHTALAVQTNRPITSDDYISDFRESLLETCGSFVEVHSDGTLWFIHLSVQEFLADPSPEFHNSEFSQTFHVQKEIAHCSMATLCVSYIVYNIPHKPIAATGKKVEATDLQQTYPLLSYVTKWWPTHACQSLRLNNLGSSGYSLDCYRVFFKLLAKAVWNKELLSSWVETSYTFHNVPSLSTLGSCIGMFHRKYPDIWRLQVESVLSILNRLSPELRRLNADWGHVLQKEPNEIWMPSINAVGGFDLWASSGDSKMNFLESKEDEGSILIASQVSADGRSVGMLKIWTPTSKDIENRTSDNSEYWQVAYQIWSLETMSQTECIRFEIPQEQLLVLDLENQDGESLGDTKSALTRFRFPAAFSSSLSLLIVHGILLKIAPAAALEKLDDRGHFQVLPPPGCEHTLDMDALTMARPMHTGRKRFSFTRGFKIVPADHKCHTWAQYLLSPNEKYLIQINGSGPPSTAHTRRWVVSAYKDTQFDNWEPSFYLVASVGIQFRRSSIKDNTVERFLSFHPFLPIVAVCRLATISLWYFMEKDKELVTVHDTLLDNICWSVCGNYLQGIDPSSKQMGFIDLTTHMPPPMKTLEATQASSPTTPAMSIASIINPNSENMQINTAGQSIGSKNSTSNAVQCTSTPVFSASGTELSFSALNQNQDGSSAICLQKIGPGGVITNSNLMRLPKSSTLEKSYSTLVNIGDTERLRLVLNMAAQETYSVEDKADFNLPAIFDRKTESILTVEEEHRMNKRLKVVGGSGQLGMLVGRKAREALVEDTVMADAYDQ